MKYYIAEIAEQNGEKEYVEKFLLTIENGSDIEEKACLLWLNWYDNSVDYFDEYKTSYWNEDSLVNKITYKQITLAKYNVLKEYLTSIHQI